MKPTSLFSSGAVAALLAMAVFATATVAQAPQGPPPEGHMERHFPPPSNLKVLPKDLTAEQVHQIMHKWAGSLGVECDTCHAADPNHVGPNGRPRLNFPDDSKPEKNIARLMYTMTQEMNAKYISKAMQMDTSSDDASPVTCGTCHRGHLRPEEFVIPQDHWHGGPPPATGAPAAH